MYGVLDVAIREFRHVAAGHAGPLHLPAQGPPEILESPGVPDRPGGRGLRGAATSAWRAGDRLYLYSDGLPDAMNPAGERFGDARLLEAIGRDRGLPLAEGIATLLAEIERWHGGGRPQDDISILGVEVA